MTDMLSRMMLVPGQCIGEAVAEDALGKFTFYVVHPKERQGVEISEEVFWCSAVPMHLNSLASTLNAPLFLGAHRKVMTQRE